MKKLSVMPSLIGRWMLIIIGEKICYLCRFKTKLLENE